MRPPHRRDSSQDLYTAAAVSSCGLDGGGRMIDRVLFLADIFPGGGGPLADVFAIAIALVLFALLYWAIDLIDRI